MSQKIELMLRLHRDEVEPCNRCEIAKKIRMKVFGDGNVSARIMLVGEAPGFEEDACGKPFQGAAGQLLNKILKDVGLDRAELFIANACKCFPTSDGKGRNPTDQEIDNCRPFLVQQLSIVQPKVIVALGGVAAASILGRKKKDIKISEYAGTSSAIADPFTKRWAVFTYHPAYPIHRGHDVSIIEKMRDHLKKAKEMADAAD